MFHLPKRPFRFFHAHVVLTLVNVSNSFSGVSGFVVPSLVSSPLTVHQRSVSSLLQSVKVAEELKYSTKDIPLPGSPNVANRALLISSFTDGVAPNKIAREFVRNSLISKLANDALSCIEQDVAVSAEQSPCCGPNVETLSLMEQMDESLKLHQRMESKEAASDLLNIISNMNEERTIQLRLLYIPTAMYALRSDSSNTPGKQRQRARYDAKQRRIVIEQFLVETFQELMSDIDIQVLSVTLDLDDGSIKHPSCTPSNDTRQTTFPNDGIESLSSWSPHMIYVEGGNTFWLTHCLRKGAWENKLIGACR